MYAGRKVEEAPVHELFAHPQHPYTIGLLGAIPRPGAADEQGRLREIPGRVPSLAELPAACAFAPRCPRADDRTPVRAPRAARGPSRRTSSRASTLARTRWRMDDERCEPTLEVVDLVKHFHVGSRARRRQVGPCTPSTVSRSRSLRASCSASSANQAAARPRSRTASFACSSRPRARSGSRGRTSRTSRVARYDRCAATCTWSSRIPTRRSTRG